MKAAIRRRYGSPDQIKIETVDQPTPKDHEALVKIHATTVNRTDCANLTAKPFIMRFVLGFSKPRKITLGTDFAGEIVAIGKDVTSFQVGQRVFGFIDLGAESHAEYAAITADHLFPIPDNITYDQAAASLEGANYAYTFIHKVSLQPGQKVLINGATGGIGSALLQFVKQFDVEVAATCNTKNIELIKSLGADKTYDYTKEDFTAGHETYDYIFDAVGKSTFGKCKPLLKKNGVYISSELGPYSQNLLYAALSSFFTKKVIFPVPYSKDKTIPYISSLLEQQKFQPVIDRKYELEQIHDAYHYVLTGEKTGNVLIQITKAESES